ncbi:DUF5694 domain-containing protein [Kordiimonas marina]|uniref:DUF5694 domain-containing protein n=1 Tax=Kordiimonas marina TaxID=2872312 RepID=UPI001FF68747|nr:DUF5694 domain-containing protein [Kordiimonas marina]MCJ9427951.1 DUF5694 domain-containing protein [Kordiimonas marina]
MINSLLASIALLAAVEIPADAPANAPAPIAAPNPVTENAQAVYLADDAAKARGHRSELAVLGTAHLSHLPKDFDFNRFDPLLARLKAWGPDRITIEAISGAQCDYLRAHAFAYPGTADDYCPDPTAARKALGVTGAEAEERIAHILATKFPDRPASVRRQLAALFLADGDPSSAMVQWFRLPPDERKAADGLTPALASNLDKRLSYHNENVSIGAKLAAALKLDRVYPIDDHVGEASGKVIDQKLFGQVMQKIWNNDWVKIRLAANKDWDKRIATDPKTSVLAWYRQMNSPEEARRAVASDFGAAAGSNDPHGVGRNYLAYWETRNMYMAASIRQVLGDGHRVLAIVGASHKPYFERYLGVSSDLKIVDIEPLLR